MKSLVLTGLLCCFLFSCTTEDSSVLTTVTTHDVTGITPTSATSGGTMATDEALSQIDFGLVWSTEPEPKTRISAQVPGGTNPFSYTMTELSPNTRYYVRAFATNDAGTAYGEELSFLTPPHEAAVVTTSKVVDITKNSALVEGEVVSTGTSEVTDRGFAYGTTSTPVFDGPKVSAGTGIGPMSVQLQGLTENTKYFVRAYAVSEAGVSYGSEITFTTLSVITIKTYNPTAVTFKGASVQGEVTTTSNVIEKGVVYGQTSLPTVEGAKIVKGSGSGSFSVSIVGLSENTKYFARAYATRESGTTYGNEITFTTKVEFLPVSFRGLWFNINGQQKYIVEEDAITFADTYISYLCDAGAIAVIGDSYEVTGKRIGWTNDPVIFTLKQGSDLNALTIGSRLSASQTLWKVVGRTVMSVKWGTGLAELSQTGENTWTEKNDEGVDLSWIYTETSRDNWSVYLNRNDGARTRIDINSKAILFSSTPNGAMTILHQLTSWY